MINDKKKPTNLEGQEATIAIAPLGQQYYNIIMANLDWK